MKIVLSGFYGLGNIGDEAILTSIINQLRKEMNNPDITVFTFSPEKTAETHHVKCVFRGWRYDNKQKIKALKNANILISGGGGLLQDTYPTRFLFGPLPYYLLIIFLAKLCGTKVMMFSQGIGPINSRWGKLLVRIFANMADLITVRDQYSKELLASLNVTKPKTIVTADIVFSLDYQQDNTCIQSLPLNGNEKIIGVSIRPWFSYMKHYHQIAEALDKLIDTNNVTPIFIPMEGHHDVEASKKVLTKMKHHHKCHILSPDFTPNQYLQFFSCCEMTIGIRLHSLIFSSLVNVPYIGISYDPKVESFLKRSEMWKYSFTLENLEASKLVENAEYVLNNKDHFKQVINQSNETLKKDALQNIALLKKYFSSGCVTSAKYTRRTEME